MKKEIEGLGPPSAGSPVEHRKRTKDAKHTPGPWRVVTVPHAHGVRRLIMGAATIELATVRGDPRAAAVNDANAKLIAAAPALADLLGRIREQLHIEGRTTLLIDEALRAAGRLA